MSLGWQILMPPFDYDLGDAGKMVSDGWVFFTSYNTERATGKLEVTAASATATTSPRSTGRWPSKLAAKGEGDDDRRREGASTRQEPGPRLLHALRQVAARRRRLARRQVRSSAPASCRASPPPSTGRRSRPRSRNKDFTGDEDGIPVLKYESIKDAEVPVGLGPLHTQFGPDGYAYTSLFVDSAIAKWKLGTWEVVDKVPMSYSIGHLCRGRGRHREPRRQVPGRPQQALPRPAPLASAPRSPSRASSWTSARRR